MGCKVVLDMAQAVAVKMRNLARSDFVVGLANLLFTSQELVLGDYITVLHITSYTIHMITEVKRK